MASLSHRADPGRADRKADDGLGDLHAATRRYLQERIEDDRRLARAQEVLDPFPRDKGRASVVKLCPLCGRPINPPRTSWKHRRGRKRRDSNYCRHASRFSPPFSVKPKARLNVQAQRSAVKKHLREELATPPRPPRREKRRPGKPR